jgi:hypothetical protein
MNTPQNKTYNPFKGDWNLSQISGGFSATEQFENGDAVFYFMENDSFNVSLGITLENSSKLPYKNDTTLYYEYDSIEIVIGDKEFEYVIADCVLKLIENKA